METETIHVCYDCGFKLTGGEGQCPGCGKFLTDTEFVCLGRCKGNTILVEARFGKFNSSINDPKCPICGSEEICEKEED